MGWSLHQEVEDQLFLIKETPPVRFVCVKTECQAPGLLLVVSEPASGFKVGRVSGVMAQDHGLCIHTDGTHTTGTEQSHVRPDAIHDPNSASMDEANMVPTITRPPMSLLLPVQSQFLGLLTHQYRT